MVQVDPVMGFLRKEVGVMPKEILVGSPDPNSSFAVFRVKWGWGPDAQLSVSLRESDIRMWLDDPNRLTDAQGTVEFYSAPIDRHAFNNTIRLLRKVRDKTFGRDE